MNPLKSLLKKRFRLQSNNLKKQLPWYLVLGPAQSGKTTLLSHADLNFIASKQFTERFSGNVFASTTCNWWPSDKGMFLDVPGHFLQATPGKQSTAWLQLLELIKKRCRQQPLKGVIIVMNLYEIAHESPNQDNIEKLQKSLATLYQTLKEPVPLYFAFTQCDRLVGFNEFFSDLGPNERQNYWGFSLQYDTENKTTIDLLKEEYDHFLKRLHQRIIWKMHHERNQEIKFLIKDFPVQLESLKPVLAKMVGSIIEAINSDHSLLTGVYFCSGTQKGEQVNRLLKTHLPVRTIDAKALTPVVNFPKPYFIHEFFNTIVLNPAPPLRNDKIKTKTIVKTLPTGYLLMTIPPLLAGIFWIQSYRLQNHQLQLATRAYVSYQEITKTETLSPAQLLLALNYLQNTSFYLESFNPSLGIRKHVYLKKNWEQTVHSAYKETLHKRLLPQIATLLEEKLLASKKTQPELAYNLLKSYLMLSDPTHFDAAYLSHALSQQDILLGLSESQQEQYYAHLMQALALTPAVTISANPAAVEHARTLLDDTPYPLLAYALVKNASMPQTLKVFEDKNFAHAFHFADAKFNFSTLYTADRFSDIYNNLIPSISQDVSAGNWVLGKKNQNALSPEEMRELIQDVNDFYLSDYLANWHKFATTIQLNSFTNFAESDQLLSALSDTNSAFETLLQTLAIHTSLPALTKKITDPDKSKNFAELLAKENFESFNQVAQNTNLTHNTVAALHRLSNDIHYVVTQENQKEAAVVIAQNYVQNLQNNPIAQLIELSNAYPAPIKNWLETIAYGNWKLLLDASYQSMSATWKNTIVNYYRSTLNQRYPLYKQAVFEAKVADFKQFFSPQGMMASFFNHYLKGFVDTDKTRWQLIKLAGLSLPIADEVIEQFERASIISRMYFPQANDEIGFRFFLEPIALMPGLKNVVLRDSSGKEIIDLPNQENKPSAWNWPPENKQGEVSVELNSNEGQSSLVSKKGEWAWFHLFDQARLQQTDDPKKFELIFDANGNSARYMLLANNAINPFIPGIIERFRCPDSL